MDHTLDVDALHKYFAFFPQNTMDLFGDQNFNFDTSNFSPPDLESLSNGPHPLVYQYSDMDLDIFGPKSVTKNKNAKSSGTSTCAKHEVAQSCQAILSPPSVPESDEVSSIKDCKQRPSRVKVRQLHCVDSESTQAEKSIWEGSVSVFPVQHFST
jgi:hypothetical protein